MKNDVDISGYRYHGAEYTHAHAYLIEPVLSELESHLETLGAKRPRVFDLGCGNGVVANRLAHEKWEVAGVDVSIEGIEQANKAFPNLDLRVGSAYDNLAAEYGTFPAVISLEVVEHVYAPRHYAKTIFDLLEPGGVAIISTPYHGYLKNVALALTGKMDNHFTALWDHGHIKFWSMRTLSTLLTEVGFGSVKFRRVGRVAPLAKSMIAIAYKPV